MGNHQGADAFSRYRRYGRDLRGIAGSLITFGLYFSGDDPMNFEAAGKSIMMAQKFMAYFEDAVGHMYCADIIEAVILGRRLNPGESAVATQFVRKISGFTRPSSANQEAFDDAVEEITRASETLLNRLVTSAAPKNREVEAVKAHARAIRRFGQ